MNKQKRMVYIYEENVDFYDELENKSQFINDALQDSRLNGRIDPQKPSHTTKNTTADPYDGVNYNADPRIEETKRKIAEIDARRQTQ